MQLYKTIWFPQKHCGANKTSLSPIAYQCIWHLTAIKIVTAEDWPVCKVCVCSSIKSPELYQSSTALLPNSQHGCPSKQWREIICSHQLLGYSLWMTDVCECKWECVPCVIDSCALIAYANWMSERWDGEQIALQKLTAPSFTTDTRRYYPGQTGEGKGQAGRERALFPARFQMSSICHGRGRWCN